MRFSWQVYWGGLPFPPPMDHVLSELSSMTCLFWVTLHGMAHSFIELCKPLHHDKAVIHAPLPLASLLFSGICKSSSDKHFDFLHFFFLGMVCAVSQTSVHSPSGALSIRSNPFRRSLYQIWSLQARSLSLSLSDLIPSGALSIRSDPFRRILYQI